MKTTIRAVAAVVTLAAASAAAQSGTCALFTRPTDTVRIGSNTSFSGDYTLEWSGFMLDQPVATNPPATFNARVWSEQDSVTEDKMLALNPNRTPVGWVNSCYDGTSGPSALPMLQRTHVALVRFGGVRKLYVNGVAVATSNEPCAPLNGGGSNMALGAFVYVGQPASNYWRAAPVALDWIRVSNSARYSGGFTPPSEASLGLDAQTQLLMNFEGPNPWRDLANPSAQITPGAGVLGGTSPTISPADCNNDGIVDFGQILDGTFPDANGNGVPDCCDLGVSCVLCFGDVSGNRTVDAVDLAALLAAWGTSGQGEFDTDVDNSGVVDGADLALLLSAWGPCPQ